jgi:hypothetical protein
MSRDAAGRSACATCRCEVILAWRLSRNAVEVLESLGRDFNAKSHILNDELGAAVYGEHQRGPTPLEPADIVLLA